MQCKTEAFQEHQSAPLCSRGHTGMISLLASHFGYTVLLCFFGFRRYFRSACRSVRLLSSSGTPLHRGIHSWLATALHRIPACSAPRVVCRQVTARRSDVHGAQSGSATCEQQVQEWWYLKLAAELSCSRASRCD